MHPVRGELVCIMVMNFVLESNIMVMMWDNKKLRRKVKEREREKQRRKVREEEEEATREKNK
jgi:hypothetical protein